MTLRLPPKPPGVPGGIDTHRIGEGGGQSCPATDQLRGSLEGLSKDQIAQAVIVYTEPVWAIGTSRVVKRG